MNCAVLSDPRYQSMKTVADESLCSGVVFEFPLSFLKALMVDARSFSGQFLTKKRMEHLVIEDVGDNVFRHPPVVQSSVNNDRLMGRIKVPQCGAIGSLAPGNLTNCQGAFEVGLIEFLVKVP